MTARRKTSEKVRLERKALSKGVRTFDRKKSLTDLSDLRVLAIAEHGPVTVLKVALTESDRVLVEVGSAAAVKAADRNYKGDVARPIVTTDDGHALVLRVNVAHVGLVVGSIIDVRVRFSVDTNFEMPIVEASSAALTVRRLARPVASITLPDVRLVSITDEMVGLAPHEGAQLKAEEQIRIAAAARLRAELAAERDDAAILTQLRRLELMPLPRWMRPEGESAACTAEPLGITGAAS